MNEIHLIKVVGMLYLNYCVSPFACVGIRIFDSIDKSKTTGSMLYVYSKITISKI